MIQILRRILYGLHRVIRTGKSCPSSTRSVGQQKDLEDRKGLCLKDQPARCEPEAQQSNALPVPGKQSSRKPARPTIRKHSVLQIVGMDARSIVACNNIETEESNGGYQLSQGSVVLDGSDSPFIQPGMTGQESANLLSASVLHKQCGATYRVPAWVIAVRQMPVIMHPEAG